MGKTIPRSLIDQLYRCVPHKACHNSILTFIYTRMHINLFLNLPISSMEIHRDLNGGILHPRFLRLPSHNCHRSAPEVSITAMSRLKHSDTGSSHRRNVEQLRCSLCGPRTRDSVTAAWYPTPPPPRRTSQGLGTPGVQEWGSNRATPGTSGGAVAGLIRECLVVCKIKDDLPERMHPSGGAVPIHHSEFNN